MAKKARQKRPDHQGAMFAGGIAIGVGVITALSHPWFGIPAALVGVLFLYRVYNATR